MRIVTANGPSENILVQVALPASLLAEQGISSKEASDELLRAYILSLYRRDVISAGKAAELLGVPRVAFLRMLDDEGISYLDYTADELDTELQVASLWPKQS